MKKIVVCGMNPAWQKTLKFDRLVPYEVNRAKTLQIVPSGKGINFARAAGIWGEASVSVVQPLGGITGKLIMGALAGEGIPSAAVSVAAQTRTCSTLMCSATGTATEIIEPSGAIQPEEYERILTVAKLEISSSDAFAFCGTFPPGIPDDCFLALTVFAAKAGKPVFLDACKGIGDALKSGAAILKINRAELEGLTGCGSVEAGIRKCLEESSLEAAAITAGKDHAFIGTRKKIVRITIPQIRNAVNPIGAGDTCSGVFFSEYLNGTDLVEAFARGLCAATASCMTETPAVFSKKKAELLRSQLTFDELEG